MPPTPIEVCTLGAGKVCLTVTLCGNGFDGGGGGVAIVSY